MEFRKPDAIVDGPAQGPKVLLLVSQVMGVNPGCCVDPSTCDTVTEKVLVLDTFLTEHFPRASWLVLQPLEQ
jgi:hypothetical protein